MANPAPTDPTRPGWLKIALWVVLALAVLAAAAFLFVLPRIPAVKAWRSADLAQGAIRAMDAGDWAEAHAKTISAYQLAPGGAAALRAAARLNSAAGMPQALTFYRSLLATGEATPDDELGYAEALLRAGAYPAFLEALEKVKAQWPGDPRVGILTARYAYVAGDWGSASRLLQDVINDPKATADQKALAAETLFSVPLAGSKAVAAEWLLAHRPEGGDSRILDRIIASPDVPEDLRVRAAAAVNKLPGRRFDGLIEIAASRLREHPEAREEVFADLLRSASTTDDQRALASFFVRSGENERALKLLPLPLARTRKDLFLVWLDATAGLGRWSEVLNVLKTGGNPIDPALQELYIGRSHEALGEESSAVNAFDRAARSPTEDRDLLFYLAGYFNQRNRLPLAEIVLRRLTADPLASRSAYEALLNLYRVRGDTAGMLDILDEMNKRWPKDPAVSNDRNYLLLLSNRDIASTLERSRVLMEENPELFPLKITHALALLQSDRPSTALQMFEASNITFGQLLPGQKAVFAALLNSNNMKEAAESVRAGIDPAVLLPEERGLIGK